MAQSVMGEVTTTRSELLTDLAVSTGTSVSGSVILSPANFPWFKNIAKAFERVRWNSCVLEYRPAVGANTDGVVALGLDWGAQSATVDEASGLWKLVRSVDKNDVLACVPSVDTPVWNRVPSLIVPANRLQSRAWYDLPKDVKTDSVFDAAPGSVLYHVSGSAAKTYGELWVKYSVTLSGTRKV